MVAQSLDAHGARSSDAIPVHLITQEAIGVYLTKLQDDGVLVFHISNRHLELTDVLTRVAAEHGLITYLNRHDSSEPFGERLRTSSIVLAMARHPEALRSMAQDDAWSEVKPDLDRRPWTDDYSNILEAIIDAR